MGYQVAFLEGHLFFDGERYALYVLKVPERRAIYKDEPLPERELPSRNTATSTEVYGLSYKNEETLGNKAIIYILLAQHPYLLGVFVFYK